LFEMRFHGRGGQGGVTSAQLLATAAVLDGHYAHAFPFFMFERRGAPVLAFMRIDDKPITIKTDVYNPDCIVVLDHTLPRYVNVTEGLKEGGIAVLNTSEPPEKIGLNVNLSKIGAVDATTIATDIFGPSAIVITSTAMLGAFVATTRLVSLDSVIKAVGQRFTGEVGERNIRAVKTAHEKTRVFERGGR
jgi:2-oxoacid:acceptor oxidoreductase gamma subunit (pyruvate/2-ketoisovalerate family)